MCTLCDDYGLYGDLLPLYILSTQFALHIIHGGDNHRKHFCPLYNTCRFTQIPGHAHMHCPHLTFQA